MIRVLLKFAVVVAIFLMGAVTFFLSEDFIKSAVFWAKSTLASDSVQELSEKTTTRKIQSVNYPILVNEMDLQSTSLLPGGGSIGQLCGELTVLDRSGSFFSLKEGKLIKAAALENGFQEFIFDYQSENFNSLRAHDFRQDDGKVYVSYTFYAGNQNFEHRLTRFDVDCSEGAKLSSEAIIWSRELSEPQALSTQAAGGALLVTKESVYHSFGFVDLSQWENLETVSVAQNSNTGIIVEISKASGDVRNFTSGHRNVSSIVMRNGEVFSLEHSMKGGDEINRLTEGYNFGYPFVTYGTKYSSYAKPKPAVSAPDGVDLQEPFWSFVPSVAPGDAYYLTDSVFERWNDAIIVGGLKSRSVFIGKMNGDRLVYLEPIFIGERVRSVTYFDEALYLLTDSAKVLELTVDSKSLENDTGGSGLVARSPHLKKCVVCHLLEPSEIDSAPHLFGVVGRPIGSLAYDYTPEFGKLEGQVWTKDLLIQFIRDPESLIKGSSMPSVGVNAIEADNIYEELRKLK